MSEKRIDRMRRKFILASTLSFFLVMLLMGGLIYAFILITDRNETRQIMEYIVENDGDLPEYKGTKYIEKYDVFGDRSEENDSDESDTNAEKIEELLSDQSSYSDTEAAWSLAHFFGTGNVIDGSEDFAVRTRYFAVLFDENDEVTEVKSRHMAHVDENLAEYYARLVRKRLFRMGRFETYYYYVDQRIDEKGTIVIYLDRTSQVFIVTRIFFFTLILLGAGSLLAFAIMRVLSHRIVRQEVENIRLQKQFITNASHELKTPLAVIRANTEMQEMLGEESEWTQSTMRQVQRMEGLIKNLVMIARSQEQSSQESFRVIPISGPVSETAESFRSVAASENKTLQTDISGEIAVWGDESNIRQLVSLLTDNAVKYCDPGGTVRVSLKKIGKAAILTVSNTYIKETDTSRFFERFYREDTSHSEKGGYGIGLSVAESLTRQMNGSIRADWKEGEILFTCRFPVRGNGKNSAKEPVNPSL